MNLDEWLGIQTHKLSSAKAENLSSAFVTLSIEVKLICHTPVV
jgi:hypothetical protein